MPQRSPAWLAVMRGWASSKVSMMDSPFSRPAIQSFLSSPGVSGSVWAAGGVAVRGMGKFWRQGMAKGLVITRITIDHRTNTFDDRTYLRDYPFDTRDAWLKFAAKSRY